MKGKRWLLSIVSMALIVLVGSTVFTGSYFTDPESSVDNTLGIASSWTSWLTGWCYRVKITIDHNDFDEDATHFPVLVHLSETCGKGGAYDLTPVFDEVGANSKKIAVTEDDGETQLYVEIEKWDETAEEAWLWVSKSDWTISSTADTDIYLYYCNSQPDNATYVGDSGSRTEVWDSNFKGVYHLSETAGGGSATIEVDAVSSGTGTSSPITISHTTSGTNCLMLVGIGSAGTYPTISSIKYNDKDLTLVGTEEYGSGWNNIFIYKLVPPDTGTYNLVVHFSGGNGLMVGVMTFTGVDQDTPLGTFVSAHGTGSTANVPASSAAGELVFDTVCNLNGPISVGAGQTERWNYGLSDSDSGGSTEPGAETVDMSWSVNSMAWAIGAVPIKPAVISGAVKDSTSNAYHGTDSGDPTFGATGEINGAINFDGDDDYLDMSSMNPQSYDDFTISAWYKSSHSTTVDDECIFIHYIDDAGIAFAISDDDGYVDYLKMQILVSSTNYETYYGTSDVVDQQSHYVVGTRGGGYIKLYVDGTKETDTADVHTGETIDVDTEGGPYIGDLPGATEQVYGILDEVRISDSARSAAWIKASYETQRDDLLDFGSIEGEEEEAGWLTGWCYRVKITIDHNDFDEDATHFPVLIYLSDACGIGNAYDLTPVFDEVGANSKKIAVTEDDGTTQLYVEIEKWDETAEEAWLWVSKSGWTISSTVDTDIYLYYCSTQPDNTTYVGDLGSRTEVWDSNFQAVWHLGDTGGGGGSWLSDWAKRVKITIDSTDIDENLTHFPVLVHLSGTCGKGSAYDMTPVFDEVGANSKRIAVTEDDAETQLYVEIEKWDETAEEAWLWVSKSDWTISSTTDTDIYLYYDNTQPDNTTYIGDSGSRTEVWDSNFKGVWHMNTSSWLDSTSTGNTLTASGNPATGSGKLGRGVVLDGTGDYLRGNYSNFNNASAGTYEFWLYYDTAVSFDGFFTSYNIQPHIYNVGGSGMRVFIDCSSGRAYDWTASGALSTGVWMHFVVTANSTIAKLYKDGTKISEDSTPAYTLDYVTDDVYIGTDRGYSDRDVDGTMDEVRISNIGRSAAWIAACYETQIDDFLDFGSGETPPDTVRDSTANNNDGTDYGSPTFGATGEINGAIDFDGDDDYLDVSSMNPQSYDDFTISAWYKASHSAVVDDECIFSHLVDYADGPGIVLSLTDDGSYADYLRVSIYDNSNNYTPYYGTSDVVDQQFHYVVGTRGGGRIKLYVDGTNETDAADVDTGETINVDATSGPHIGDLPGDTEQLYGILDEIRISGTARSAAWIGASYESERDDLLDFGSEETPPSEAPIATNSTGASDVTNNSARLNGELTAGYPDPTVRIYWGDNDGGTTPASWDNDEDLGTKPIGAFYKDITGLTASTTYYYRCYATNSAGDDWADSTEQFTTESAPPAFPTVAAVNGGSDTNSATNHTVNLPSGIETGDLLLIFFGVGEDADITTPTGWTQLFKTLNGDQVRFACYCRVADGTEGSTITITTSWGCNTVHTTYRITGYSGTPEVGTPATGTSANPDPSSTTPSWGAQNTLWLASCAYRDGTQSVSAYPTNYTNGRNDRDNDDWCAGVGTARRELNAASEDPGTFTISASKAWVAATVAIRGSD